MRLIDADALKKRISDYRCADCNDKEHGCVLCQWDDMVQMIEDAPTVDAAPVVHGRWVNRKTWDKAVCSNCSFENAEMTKFCPNCGAKMDD